jgi:hypothetical protein
MPLYPGPYPPYASQAPAYGAQRPSGGGQQSGCAWPSAATGPAAPPARSLCVVLTYAGRYEVSDPFPPGLTGHRMVEFVRTFAQQRYSVRNGGWAVSRPMGGSSPRMPKFPRASLSLPMLANFL